jgi:hypothetical protein
MMHSCRYHLHNLVNEADPLYYLLTHDASIRLSLDYSVESRWRELKKQLRNEITLGIRAGDAVTDYRYHDALESVFNRMTQLEEK